VVGIAACNVNYTFPMSEGVEYHPASTLPLHQLATLNHIFFHSSTASDSC
jgi:hypothetical protein